jgi:hypothetical protein
MGLHLAYTNFGFGEDHLPLIFKILDPWIYTWALESTAKYCARVSFAFGSAFICLCNRVLGQNEPANVRS